MSELGRRLIAMAGWLVLSGAACGQEEEAPPTQPPPQRNWSQEVAASVENFELFIGPEATDALKPVPAYQWANPGRPNVLGERLCLLFFDQGRPVASCKVYPTGGTIVHTFISMTDKPIECRQGGTVIWAPPEAGLDFQSVPDAPEPAEKAVRRMIQMKSMARRFSALTGDGEARRQKAVPELRLLPTPLYRYPAQDQENFKQGVIDGAVFAFVVGGGNPQMFLIIEAVRTDGKTAWRFAFSRRTFAELKAFYDEREVWQVPYLPPGRMVSTSDFFKVALPVR